MRGDEVTASTSEDFAGPIVTAVTGTYPFGQPLRVVLQRDRTPKHVFVLGVYASAVHARWLDADRKLLIRALAVASEPTIFWDGTDAAQIIARITLPDGAGTLESADESMNGPSGRALDEHYLEPLGSTRSDAWLCDLVPHTCMNPGQARALEREYTPRAKKLRLPRVDLPPVPKAFADAARQDAVLAEFEESRAETLVLLGDEPIRHWLKRFDARWSALRDFGESDGAYGRRHVATIAGRRCEVIPLVHPRQAAGLGSHSAIWRARHGTWQLRAPDLAARIAAGPGENRRPDLLSRATATVAGESPVAPFDALPSMFERCVPPKTRPG